MTEGNDNGSNLVRVRAQVMMRDDSTGGWVPVDGGGLSNVSVHKRISRPDVDNIKHEYLIYGKRISDQNVVLRCAIKKDFEYNKVMPTFHHWKTGDHKYGLTFQTAADARAFDKGVRQAVDDLLDGLNEIPSCRYGRNLGDDDVFVAVDLPVDRDGSLSSSGSSTTHSNSSRRTPTTVSLPTPNHHHHHNPSAANTTPNLPLHIRPRPIHPSHHVPHNSGTSTPFGTTTTNTSPASTISSFGPLNYSHLTHPPQHRIGQSHRGRHTPSPNNGGSDKILDGLKGEHEKLQDPSDPYFVHIVTKELPPLPLHDYSSLGPFKSERKDSIASLKKQQQQMELIGKTDSSITSFPGKKGKKNRRNKMSRMRCKHCNDSFSEEFNTRGSCEYSPDYVKNFIDKVTCIHCTKCILYHCMRNAEGEFPSHPCECEDTEERFSKRYVCLSILSLFLPCMWCYLPMRACHRCAVSCSVCGGKHEAS